MVREWISASPGKRFSKESTGSIHPFIPCVTLGTAKESFCFLPGEKSLCCRRDWNRHVSIHIWSLNDKYVRSFRMNIPVWSRDRQMWVRSGEFFFRPFAIDFFASLEYQRVCRWKPCLWFISQNLGIYGAVLNHGYSLINFLAQLATPCEPAL